MKSSILRTVVLFLLLLLGAVSLAGPARADPTMPPSATVVYESELYLPLTGQRIIRSKTLDPTTGTISIVATDAGGAPIDLEQVEMAEHATYEHRYGNLEPILYERLQSAAPDALIPVVVWLRTEEPDTQVAALADRYSDLNIVAGRPMIEPTDAAAKQRIDAYLSERQAALAAYHFSLEQPIVGSLTALGYEVQTFSAVPNVSAVLPASIILELAQREDVDTIYLGGMTLRDETDSAAPTDHVLPVWDRGVTGRGITVTVVEGNAIDYDNPYLSGITRPGAWVTGTGHTTRVAGVIASTHPSFRGIAPDANLVSAPANVTRDGNNANDDDALAAIEWGLQQGSRIFNNSYGTSADNQMHRLDRAFDYLVRHSFVTLVKSAGNEGNAQPLTTPGLGYNVIAVGGYHDRNTVVWTDDTVYGSSSAVDPPRSDGTFGDREKPEVSAVAQGIRSTRTSTYHTNNNSWISLPAHARQGTSYAAPQVAGLAALLMERQTGLTLWPETTRAVVMASAFHNIEGNSRLSEIDGAGAVDMLAADETARNRWYTSTLVFSSTFSASGYLTYTFPVTAGEKVRVAICWNSNPAAGYGTDPLDADLDLTVYDPNGAYVDSSLSNDNNYEIVEFTATVTGDYALRIHKVSFNALSEWLGVAWAKRTLIISPYDEQPAYAGARGSPGKIIVHVVRERAGLGRGDFQVRIDGVLATVNMAYEGEAEYVLEVTPPNRPADGPYDLSVQVSGETDISPASVQYGAGNVDIELVIDRSGSMETTPMNHAKNAAKQFVDLMEIGDMVGVVSFDDVVETDFALTTITSTVTRQNARSAIDALYSRDMTSIGGGLQRGQEQLTSLGNAAHPWAIVLLTDGQENTAPMVADVLPAIAASKTIVHTIGLGGGIDETLLLDIASQTGGTYSYAPSSAELPGIYSTIVGTVSGQQTLFSASGVAETGVTDELDVIVDSTVSTATFSVSWTDSSATITLTLRNPHRIINSGHANSTTIRFTSGSTYQYFRIGGTDLVTGTWQMRISGGTMGSAVGDKPAVAPAGESYVVRATGNTNLTMNLYLDRDSYLIGDFVHIAATLADTQPIAGATVNLDIETPSSGTTTLTLYNDGEHNDGTAGDGVYGGTFVGTSTPGTYRFVATASGTSNTSQLFTREREVSTYIEDYSGLNPNTSSVGLPLVMRGVQATQAGFDSQFNGSAPGWESHSGTWTVDSNYYRTTGLADTSSSASYAADFTNFDYQARLWRSGCDTCANRLLVRGTPTPLGSDNHWYSFYMFQYTRTGSYSIWKQVTGGDATELQGWTSSSAINQGDAWNTLRVVGDGSNLYFYINGTLVWSGTDSSLTSGRVGIGMYRSSSSSGDQFLADWATLSTLGTTGLDAFTSSDTVSAEQQALNDAANGRGGGSEDTAPSSD